MKVSLVKMHLYNTADEYLEFGVVEGDYMDGGVELDIDEEGYPLLDEIDESKIRLDDGKDMLRQYIQKVLRKFHDRFH